MAALAHPEVSARSIRLPEEISPLVQQVYGWERKLPVERRGRKCAAYMRRRRRKKARAEAYLVPQPETHRLAQLNTLDDWMQNEGARSDPAARAAVRDGDPSVEVLVMQRRADGSIHFLPWQEGGSAVAADSPPPPETALKIARQKLRLPAVFGKAWKVDRSSGSWKRTTAAAFCGVAAVAAAARRTDPAAG